MTNVYDGSAENNMCGAPPMPDGVRLVSGFVRATKPAPKLLRRRRVLLKGRG